MYGYIPDEIRDDHWVYGANSQIEGEILQPDGDWTNYLPSPDIQNQDAYETYSCVSQTTLHALQMLLKRKFNITDDYSPRYLATVTGTKYQKGNSPQVVSEFLRKAGCALESVWPSHAPSFDDFYAEPSQTAQNDAENFPKHYNLSHDWVISPDRLTIQTILKSSPLGVSVYAWEQDGNGLYYRPQGAPDVHFTLLYKVNPDNTYQVFDSYDNTHKTLRADFTFGPCKRFSIDLSPVTLTLFEQLVEALKNALKKLFTPSPQTPIDTPASDTITNVNPPTYDWSTPEAARHSVRLICDEEGLTVKDKNDLCATVGGESGWDPKAVNAASKDYGIAQINEYYHVGPGKDFPSVEYVLNNPEACIRWMCKQWKTGHKNWWIAYKNGRYLRFL